MFINLIHVTISMLRSSTPKLCLKCIMILLSVYLFATVLFGGFCEALSNFVLKSATQTKFNCVAITLSLLSYISFNLKVYDVS